MGIKIVLPDGDVKSGNGTKVYADDGTEIRGIAGMTIRIFPDEIVLAKLEVCVSALENADGIVALLSEEDRQEVMECLKAQLSTATEA